MTAIVCFVMGAAAGAAVYRWLYAEKFRSQEINCNEKEQDRELFRQLERLMAYSGREE